MRERFINPSCDDGVFHVRMPQSFCEDMCLIGRWSNFLDDYHSMISVISTVMVFERNMFRMRAVLRISVSSNDAWIIAFVDPGGRKFHGCGRDRVDRGLPRNSSWRMQCIGITSCVVVLRATNLVSMVLRVILYWSLLPHWIG